MHCKGTTILPFCKKKGEKCFENTLFNYTDILNAYLDSHFDDSTVVINKLEQIFTDAGKILKDANSSLNYSHALTSENATILAGFVSDV